MAVNTVIATNMLAINSQRTLTSTSRKRNRSSARLSSGSKISTASEDASGLTISQKMKAQIRGLEMANKNTADTVSMLQVAEGALEEVSSIFQRCRELCVQISTDTNTVEDRKKLSQEMVEILDEVDYINNSTSFNGVKIFKEDLNAKFQVGANSSQSLDINLDFLSLDELMSGNDLELFNKIRTIFEETVKTTMENAIAQEPSKIGNTGTLGASYFAICDYSNLISPILDAIKDLDTSAIKPVEELKNELQGEIDSLVNQIVTQAKEELKGNNNTFIILNGKDNPNAAFTSSTVTPPSDIPFNSNTQVAVSLDDIIQKLDSKNEIIVLQTDTFKGFEIINTNLQNILNEYDEKFNNPDLYKFNILDELKGFTNGDINITSSRFSDVYITHIDKCISYVSEKRATLGATINRLEHISDGLAISSENLYAANSQIEDTDMAKEMMELTSTNILVQSTTTLLAQANSSKEDVLQLLR